MQEICANLKLAR